MITTPGFNHQRKDDCGKTRPGVEVLGGNGKGYQDCINDPEGSAEILLKAAPELDRELVIASQKWLKDQYKADAPYWGWQDGKVWANYAAWMLEKKLLQKKLTPTRPLPTGFYPDRADSADTNSA